MVFAEIFFPFSLFGGVRFGLSAVAKVFENAHILYRLPQTATRSVCLLGGEGQFPERLLFPTGQFPAARFKEAEFVERNRPTRFRLPPLFQIRPELLVEPRGTRAERALFRHGGGDFHLLTVAGILAQFDDRSEFHRKPNIFQ